MARATVMMARCCQAGSVGRGWGRAGEQGEGGEAGVGVAGAAVGGGAGGAGGGRGMRAVFTVASVVVSWVSVVSVMCSRPVRYAFAEQPLWPEQQYEDEEDEGPY